MEIVNIKIDKLKAYEKNAKIHTKENIEAIKKSIEKYGFNDPIGVWGKNNLVVEGHGRLLACKELGMEEVPCIRLDHLTEEERRGYTLLHNKTTLMTDFDLDLLSEELADLDLDDFELDWGIDELEPKKEVQEDDFDVESAIPEEPKAKYGDVYLLGEHRLMCGDSTREGDVAKLMDGAKADMVFTDPPFPNNSNIMQDMIKNIEKAFINARNVCAGVSMWFWDNLEFPPFNEKVTAKYIWHKTNGWQANHFEEIYVFHNDNVRHEQIVFSECNVGVDNERNKIGNHPTPKPIKLFCNIVRTIGLNGNKVLDLFGGSGSTLIACEQLGRKCYMMELEPKYVDVIIARWEQFTGKKAVKVN